MMLVSVRCPPRYVDVSVAPRGCWYVGCCMMLVSVRCPPRYVDVSVAPRLPDLGVLVVV